jgi:hypothetical protein
MHEQTGKSVLIERIMARRGRRRDDDGHTTSRQWRELGKKSLDELQAIDEREDREQE